LGDIQLPNSRGFCSCTSPCWPHSFVLGGVSVGFLRPVRARCLVSTPVICAAPRPARRPRSPRVVNRGTEGRCGADEGVLGEAEGRKEEVAGVSRLCK
jgi:hypothetical protein